MHLLFLMIKKQRLCPVLPLSLGGRIAKLYQYQMQIRLKLIDPTSKTSDSSCNFAVVKHLQRILEYYWLSVTEYAGLLLEVCNN